MVQKQPAVFAVVPPNWLASATLQRPLVPGQNSTLVIAGRDISPEFAKAVVIETDKEGLKVSGLRQQDATTLVAAISAAADVEPGDYIIHLSTGGKPLNLPRGSIIKITLAIHTWSGHFPGKRHYNPMLIGANMKCERRGRLQAV